MRSRSGGEGDFKYIDPVKEIFPEAPLADKFLKVFVGGRDNAYIVLNAFRGA
jgi:hypothetical protein